MRSDSIVFLNPLIMQPKGNRPDCYPLNQNNAFFMNVVLAYPFYLIAVFIPDMIWLGLAPVLFGILQFVVHGFATNRKLKSFYNPGLATVVLGHIPIGIWYLVEVYAKGMISLWNWAFTVALMALLMGGGMMGIGYGTLADKDSSYPFAPEKIERFDRLGHLACIGIEGSEDR